MNAVRRLVLVSILFASCSGLGPTEPQPVEFTCTPRAPDTVRVLWPASLRMVVGAADMVGIEYAADDGCSWQPLPLTNLQGFVRDTTVATSTMLGGRDMRVESRAPGQTWFVLQADELADSLRVVVPDTFPMGRVTTIAAGGQTTCALEVGGEVMCWGTLEPVGPDYHWEIGTCLGRPCTPWPHAAGRQADALVLGDFNSCFLDSAGTKCHRWGQFETFGEPRLVSLSVGRGHACGLTESGEAYCWGDDEFGQVGDDGIGGVTDRPQPVAGGRTWTSIHARNNTTCGVDDSGLLHCWGALPAEVSGSGSCEVSPGGKNSNPSYGPCADTPLRISVDGALGADTLATQVAGGCVLTTSGAVHCARERSVRFEPVAPPSSFERIWSGAGHYCGLAFDGTAACWGNNFYGQLGDGSRDPRPAPVAVRGGHVFIDLALGAGHSCGIDDTGVAWCWGGNDGGQAGGPILDPPLTPRVVPGQDGR